MASRFWLCTDSRKSGGWPQLDRSTLESGAFFAPILDDIRFAKWYVELTQAGDPHVHLYLHLKRARLSSFFITNLGTQIDYHRHTNTFGINYDQKEGKPPPVLGPFTYGTPTSQGRRTDIEYVVAELESGVPLLDLAREQPRLVPTIARCHYLLDSIAAAQIPVPATPPRVLWLWGDPGVGKSYVRNYITDRPVHEQTWAATNFGEYRAEPVLLIQDMRPRRKLDYFQWFTDYPMVDTKYRNTRLKSPYIIVTSNVHPSAMSDDPAWVSRYSVFHVCEVRDFTPAAPRTAPRPEHWAFIQAQLANFFADRDVEPYFGPPVPEEPFCPAPPPKPRDTSPKCNCFSIAHDPTNIHCILHKW